MKRYIFYLGHIAFNQLYSRVEIGDPSILQMDMTPIDVYSNKKATLSKAFYGKPQGTDEEQITTFLHYNRKVDYHVLANLYKNQNVANIVLLNPNHDKNVYTIKNDSNINIYAINNKINCIQMLSILINWEMGLKEIQRVKIASIIENTPEHMLVYVPNAPNELDKKSKSERAEELIHRLQEAYSDINIPRSELKKYCIHQTDIQNTMKIILAGKIERIFYLLFALILSCCITLLFLCVKLYFALNKRDPVCTLSEINSCPTKTFSNCSKQFESCLICMETFQNTEKIRELLCGHYYHVVCIDPWLKGRSARCPYCRTLMKQNV